MAVGGWLGTRSARLHFCGDRGSAQRYRGRQGGTLGTRRGGSSAATLRLLLGSEVPLGVWRAATIGRIRAEGKKGEGTRNEIDPALFGLCRGRCRPAGAAGLGMASATGLATMAGISPGTIFGISLGTMSGINPGTMCGIRPGIISGPSRRHYVWYQAQRRVGYQPRHQEWYQLQQNVWYPPGWYQPQRASRVPAPAAMSLDHPAADQHYASVSIAGLLTARRSMPPPGPAATPASTT